MSQRRKGQTGRPAAASAIAPAHGAGAVNGALEAPTPGRWLLVCLLLAVATGASLLLVLERLGGVSLPGCGLDAACGRATRSAWGTLPVVGWPTSFLGLSWFGALLVAWIATRGRFGAWLRPLLWVSAFASAVLVGAMVVGGYLCPYCLAVHAANLLLVGLLLLRPGWLGASPPWTAPSAAVVAVAAASIGASLTAVDASRRALARADSESRLSSSLDAVIARADVMRDGASLVAPVEPISTSPAPHAAHADTPTAPAPAAPPGLGNDRGDPSSTPRTAGARGSTGSATGTTPVSPVRAAAPSAGFTGRYRMGPESAAIRIVIFSDYQCPECRLIEEQARRLAEQFDTVSLSHKHFPFCIDCNVAARRNSFNPHPNACWAARAAEAAGILGGNEGFWRMHDWLFANKGAFTDGSLRNELPRLGFDRGAFLELMQSPETLALVEQDVEEGLALGLRQTPMIFINGVELRGASTPADFTRAVQTLVVRNLPPATAANDRPPMALEKHINDWVAQPAQVLPRRDYEAVLGPRSARVSIVVWGDYEEPFTAELDQRVRALVEHASDVRYEFRNYPIDQACNSQSPRTLHPNACEASRAAMTALVLNGEDAFWTMHEWILDHQASLTRESLLDAAADMGFNPESFANAMDSPVVTNAIRADTDAAKALGLRGVPFVFIDNQQVPVWRLEGEPLIERLVEEARKPKAQRGSAGAS